MENYENTITRPSTQGTLTYDPKFPVSRAAKFLGVSETSTWRLIWNGKLKSYRVNGRTLVGLSHIEKYLKEVEN